MPGHVVKSTGPDPDPTEYLFVSREMKLKDSSKPYDGKKDCWVPNEKEHFILGKITGTKGDLITVDAVGQTVNWKKDQVMQVNPPKYEKAEDMSNLTFLNDASVLYNLKARYVNRLMYTYSGLFCIAVNPYKRYPIYTDRAAKIYIGKRRNEVPPHIFAIAENGFQGMCQNHENQSMLITGESGAGKTENTKKVIAYFACVGASTKKVKPGQKAQNLEDQIVQTNPMLEAFGNAKTTRNDNSSRFGKFIRIHFGPSAKLSGADIEQYLLEKARIVSQGKMERGYHIFYEMMSDQIKFIKPLCFLTDNIFDYHYCSQGKVTVESIDDKEDMQFCEDAFRILEFKEQEKLDVYKIVGAVMHFGELKTKMRGRDEQAEPDGTACGEIVGKLLGIEGVDLYKNLCKPKIKVGVEFVSQGKSSDQVMYSVSAISKSMYDRNFKYLFRNCNRTLETGQKRVQFIGVLDIAGFEIFEFNGFEQICINFTNEKLQQFFNHHMFVLEQEEYKKEGINWTFVDFGMDLQACIELFEKPMGLLAILEEESMFPKATDQSFEDKLNTNLLGASPSFIKPKASKSGAIAHFGICHYAGCVNYNVNGWLEKNKDPLNDTLVEQLKNGSNALIVHLYADHPGQPIDAPDDKKGKGKGGAPKKGSVFKTVSSGYRDQLGSLMNTLNATQPHFIRCIVPNETKSPGVLDPHLVMHQLTCNGVLEGIRICRKGFPNRILYPEFLHRYKILATKEITTIKEPTEAAKACLVKIGMDEEKYRIGYTKVFFRAGSLGEVEEIRDDKIAMILTWMQAWIKGWYSRAAYERLKEQRIALIVVQRNLKRYMLLRNWGWYRLWQKVKPLLSVSRQEDKINAVKEKAATAIEKCQTEKNLRKSLEAQKKSLTQENKELNETLEAQAGNVSLFLEEQNRINEQKRELEGQLAGMTAKLNSEVDDKSNLAATKRKVEGEAANIKRDVEDLELVIQKLEQEKGNKDHQIRNLTDEISHQDEIINKVNKDKKHLQDCNQKTVGDLQGVEDRANHLANVKVKLDQTLDELEDSIDREKKQTAEIMKSKRRVEGDVKLTQETISDLEKNQKELENTIFRKDKEFSSLQTRLEDEQHSIAKVVKQFKELQSKIEELEEELEQERQARAKVEKAKNKILKELDDLVDRLDEAGGATAAQVELNRKRESELAKLRRDLEECNIQQDAALVSLRKKHNDGLAEMAEQLDHLDKNKCRIEKDKDGLKRETDEAKSAMDILSREKANIEKTTKSLQVQLHEVTSRYDEGNRTLHDFDAAKKKLSVENADLLHQLEEAENQNSIMTKIKTQLNNQLEDMKKMTEEESKERSTILGKFRNLEHDLDGLREQLDEELEAKADLTRLLSKSQAEANMYRSKYESEGIARAEELEASRLKIVARLEEAEQVIENLNFKVGMMDKNKDKMGGDYEQMKAEVERTQQQVAAGDKKQKHFDKVIGEYKMKVDDLAAELDSNQRECRTYSTELFRIKAAYDENLDQLDGVRKENKNLTDEIKDLMDQIGEGGRSMHEISKNTRNLENEKEELQAALEEAEAALEQEENKVLRSQLELSQVRQEIDRRISEKDDEFENTRKVHARAMESMQAAFENESRGKAEALRMKKKLESDINELQISLNHTGQANADLQKSIKKTQSELALMQSNKEEDQRLCSEYREELAISERKANALHGELEEARGHLENTDRGRRQAEAELVEAREQVNDLTNMNGSLAIAKRKLEGEMQTLHSDMGDIVKEAKKSEDKAKKAMVDAARLADELRSEQEHAQVMEKQKGSLALTHKEIVGKLDDVEINAIKASRKAGGKLESRVRELESQLDDEARRCADSQKNLRRAERRIKELTFMGEEDKKNHMRMGEQVDKLQQKIKTYKNQIEEAEEIACANLAKFRKAQQDLEIKGL